MELGRIGPLVPGEYVSEEGPLLHDRYRLAERIGAGGMGQVFRAFDEALDREVAIKRMHSAGTIHPESLLRFQREAKLTSRLGHPNIVVTHDVIESEEELAIVMELVDGPTLRDHLNDGPLAIDEAISIATQVAAGLAAVHRIGVAHRDIKPANILLEADGRGVKIADFGIASLPEGSKVTRAGAVLGTPEYMAPERFRGGESTFSFDTYALGVLLFEMITGEVPIEGNSVIEVISRLPELDSLEIRLGDSDLDEFVQRCLSTDPSKRPVDGVEALACLRALGGKAQQRPADFGAIAVVGGRPIEDLVELASLCHGEVGQNLGSDLIIRFESPERGFRWLRKVISESPDIRGAFDAGDIVGGGLGLFVGETVGRAVRLSKLSQAGDVLVTRAGRDAVGIGFRASLERLGEVHLAGVKVDTEVYRLLEGEEQAEHACEQRISEGLLKVRCECGNTIRISPDAVPDKARVVCSRCSRVHLVESQTLDAPMAEESPTRDAILLSERNDEDALIIGLVAGDEF